MNTSTQRTPQEQEIFEAEMQAWKAENAADLAIQMRRNQMHLYFELAETGNLLDLPPINVLMHLKFVLLLLVMFLLVLVVNLQLPILL